MNAAATAANYADRTGRWVAIAIGFSIPISVALDNVLLAAVFVCFCLGGRYRPKWDAIRTNPLSIAALALFALLTAGALYGEAGAKESARYLAKYLDLLFLPLFVFLFRGADDRRLGLHALAGALLATILLSFALYAGIPRPGWFVHNTVYPVVFKHNLTHAVLVAFGAFVFFQFALAARTTVARALWGIAAALSVINVAFVVPGRTGYLVLGVLALYSGYALWRRRGLIVMFAVVGLSLAVAYAGSDLLRERIDRAVREYSAWTSSKVADPASSVGLRLEFYRVSLEIVRDHPLIGVGTGGFPKAYAEKARGPSPFEVRNPHNEYLLIAVQTGFLGLALLLNLFWQQWRLATRLATPLETHLARGLVLTIAVGSLFNSLLLDHTEGLLYAWMTGLLYAGLQSPEMGNRK
ncbi:MAG: O-antigen ligase family protein [Betaproteobacteria bacterium]|nr:O-antigen ligase family protein [Betaproteobacteria bacterium]